jgi:regulator of cell morphogenesis and NO signaling
MSGFTSLSTLSSIITKHPEFATTLEGLNLDFCCGGNKTLKESCEALSLNTEEVIKTLEKIQKEKSEIKSIEYEKLNKDELIDHIVSTHHSFFKNEEPTLTKLVEKVSRVHGPGGRSTSSYLPDLKENYDKFVLIFSEHLQNEEETLFPFLKTCDENDKKKIKEMIGDYINDHEETGKYLKIMKNLTNSYEIPEGACQSFKTMLTKLQTLEQDIHIHVHKENNILFPKFLK